MTIIGPDFIALQVRDLEKSAEFYEKVVGLDRAPFSPPHAVVFDTQPTFAVREPAPGVDLDVGPLGLGAALWMHDPEASALHTALAAEGATILQEPFKGPFGRTFVFQDLDGYAVTIHDRATRADPAGCRVGAMIRTRCSPRHPPCRSAAPPRRAAAG